MTIPRPSPSLLARALSGFLTCLFAGLAPARGAESAVPTPLAPHPHPAVLQATLYAELAGSESVSIRTVAGHQDHLYVALADARGHERIDVWNTRLPNHPRLTSSLDFGSLLTNGVMFTPLALHPHDRGLLLQTRRGLAHYLLDASGRLDFERDLPPTLTGLGLGMTQLHFAGRHASLLQQVVPNPQITGDPGQRVHQQVLIDLAQPDSPRLLWGGPQGWSVQDDEPVSQLFGGNPASLHFDSSSPQVRLRVFEPRREAHRQTFWQPKLERVLRGDALHLPLRELLSRSIPTHTLAEWQTRGLTRSAELQVHPQRTLGSLILERFPPEERLSAVLDQLGLSPDLPLETALSLVISDRLSPEIEAALSEEWFSPPLRLWLENILGPDLHQATTSETRARIAGAFHADLTEETLIRQLTLEVIAPLIGNPAYMQWTLRELIEAMAHSAPGELVTLTLRTCGGFGTLNTLLDGLGDLLDWVPGLQLPSCARYPESARELIHLALFSWNDASSGRHLNLDGYAWFELLKFHRYLSGRPDLAGYQREVPARLEAMQRSLGENFASRLAPALDLGLSVLPLPKAHAAAARRLPSGLLYGRLVARGLLELMPESAGIDGAMTVRQALSHWGLRLDAPGQTGSSLAELLLSLDAIQLSERTTLELLASASHLPTADFHTHLEQVLRREIQNAFHFSDLDTPLQQLLEPVLDFDVDLQNVLGDWMSGLLHETLVSGSALPQQFLTLRRAFQQQDCIAQWLVTLDAVSLAASWIGLAEIPVALEFALREAYQAGVGYLVETMFGTLISEIVEGCSGHESLWLSAQLSPHDRTWSPRPPPSDTATTVSILGAFTWQNRVACVLQQRFETNWFGPRSLTLVIGHPDAPEATRESYDLGRWSSVNEVRHHAGALYLGGTCFRPGDGIQPSGRSLFVDLDTPTPRGQYWTDHTPSQFGSAVALTGINRGTSLALAGLDRVFLLPHPAGASPAYAETPRPPHLLHGPSLATSQDGRPQLMLRVAGTPPFTFQWTRDGQTLPDASQASLPLPLSDSAGTYEVHVSNPVGEARAHVVVTPAPAAPHITQHPTPLTVLAGQSARFEVSVASLPSPRYQWMRGDHPIAGATHSHLDLPSVTPDLAGLYRAVITDGVQILPSHAARLAVLPHHGPVLVRHPDPRSSTALGTPTQLSVRAVGWGDLEYRWFKDGAPIAGATGSELTLGPATPHTPGQFMVEVEDAAGHVTRQIFLVSVVAPAALSWSRRADGGTDLTVRHGTPGQSFQLERSSDLVNWVAGEAGTFNPTGDFQFGTLPPDSPPAATFFRVLLR